MAARKLCPSESEPFEDHPGDPMYLRLVVEFMLVLQTLSIFTEVQREMVPHFFARKAALREMFAECKDRLDIVGPGAGFADAVARFAFLHEDAAANPNVYTHLRNLYGRLRWFLDDCDSDDPTLTVRVLFRLLRKHGVTVSTSYRYAPDFFISPASQIYYLTGRSSWLKMQIPHCPRMHIYCNPLSHVSCCS